jgi:hypothetical protein
LLPGELPPRSGASDTIQVVARLRVRRVLGAGVVLGLIAVGATMLPREAAVPPRVLWYRRVSAAPTVENPVRGAGSPAFEEELREGRDEPDGRWEALHRAGRPRPFAPSVVRREQWIDRLTRRVGLRSGPQRAYEILMRDSTWPQDIPPFDVWVPYLCEQDEFPPGAEPAAAFCGRWALGGLPHRPSKRILDLSIDGAATRTDHPGARRRWGVVDGVLCLERFGVPDPARAQIVIGVLSESERLLWLSQGGCAERAADWQR